MKPSLPTAIESPLPLLLPEILIEIVRKSKWVLSGAFARCSKTLLYTMTRKEALCEIIDAIKASESRRLFGWLLFPLPSYLAPFEYEDVSDTFRLPMNLCVHIAGASAVPRNMIPEESLFTGPIISARVYKTQLGTQSLLLIDEASPRHVPFPISSGPVRGLSSCTAAKYEHHYRDDKVEGATTRSLVFDVFSKKEFSVDQVGHIGDTFYQTPLAVYTYQTHDIICTPSEFTRPVLNLYIPNPQQPHVTVVKDQTEPFWTVVERHLNGDPEDHNMPFHQCTECNHSLQNIFCIAMRNEWCRFVNFHTDTYLNYTLTYCRAPFSLSSLPIDIHTNSKYF